MSEPDATCFTGAASEPTRTTTNAAATSAEPLSPSPAHEPATETDTIQSVFSCGRDVSDTDTYGSVDGH